MSRGICGICCYIKKELKSNIKVYKSNPYNHFIRIHIIYDYKDTIILVISYFTLYKNHNLTINHPFIKLENDIATLKINGIFFFLDF
jgi:hypothetical protein